MTGEPFEFAIKKDVRNNPIVREIDRDRHREMWRAAMLGVFLVTVLLFWGWQHVELLRHGYRLEDMQRERAAEMEVNRHLRLDVHTLRSPARIERLATSRLRMLAPDENEVVVIERVLPVAPPPRSTIARR